ncbi:MAG: Methylglutaconyl-CoA hydratase, partial [uncultured Corynebacteriales bacterium]
AFDRVGRRRDAHPRLPAEPQRAVPRADVRAVRAAGRGAGRRRRPGDRAVPHRAGVLLRDGPARHVLGRRRRRHAGDRVPGHPHHPRRVAEAGDRPDRRAGPGRRDRAGRGVRHRAGGPVGDLRLHRGAAGRGPRGDLRAGAAAADAAGGPGAVPHRRGVPGVPGAGGGPGHRGGGGRGAGRGGRPVRGHAGSGRARGPGGDEGAAAPPVLRLRRDGGPVGIAVRRRGGAGGRGRLHREAPSVLGARRGL